MDRTVGASASPRRPADPGETGGGRCLDHKPPSWRPPVFEDVSLICTRNTTRQRVETCVNPENFLFDSRLPRSLHSEICQEYPTRSYRHDSGAIGRAQRGLVWSEFTLIRYPPTPGTPVRTTTTTHVPSVVVYGGAGGTETQRSAAEEGPTRTPSTKRAREC